MPMRLFYKLSKPLIFFSLLFVFINRAKAQCPDGSPNGGVAFDTTISTSTGVTTRPIRIPQFNPVNGMVTCVRLCISITAVVDTMDIENNSASPQTADVYYSRNDNITGLGLGTPLTNSFSYHYGTYNLDPSNGVPGSGPDFVAISKDTLMNAVQICRVISDSATIEGFYGVDSITYTYNISALVSPAITGGDFNFRVGTSAFVNFRFEYCTCPPISLPASINWFTVTKANENEAALKWQAAGDQDNLHYYEAEWSTDGINYTGISKLTSNESNNNDAYTSSFTHAAKEKTVYYFRIKQVSKNGKVSYSQVRQLTMGNSDFTKFSIFPNPSHGIVGIKFVNSIPGQYLIQIFNTQGQLITHKNVSISNSSYVVLSDLQLKSGMYVVKTTETRTGETGVSQLIIK